MADPSAVDVAVIGRLLADPVLTGLMPHGIFWDVANQGAKRFVIVSLVPAGDVVPMFGGTAYERTLYLVKAVEDASLGANVGPAAARIDALLHDQTFAVTGYGLMNCQRTDRLRVTEVDPANADARWQHRGGYYEVVTTPL